MKLRLTGSLGLLLVFCLFISPASAQVLTGTITGTVMDPTEAVIPGAKVTIVDLATGKEYNTTTDSTGSFTVTNLPNGFYKVTIEAPGFAKFTVPRVQALLAQTAKVTAKMELGKAGSEVVVTSEQNVVDTESAELKNSIDRAQIMNLPLPTRNPLDLVRTMAGIVTPTSSGIADAFVHGLRGNSTNITQDGINVADNFVKTSSFFAISAPTVDAVGEFNVSIGGIGVDAGFGAAQVSIRTARGTNDFHGSLFWFQRTNAFNGNVWFNNANGRFISGPLTGQEVSPRPYQLQNRIGFNAGGPIYIPGLYDGRNKTFVFGTYEAYREPVARSRTRSVLTTPARTGLFSYVPTCTVATCPVGVTPGVARQVDLLTLGNPGAVVNTAVMNFYNSLVPDFNTDSGCTSDTLNVRCYQFNLPGSSIQNRYNIRADHQLTKSHAIEFVFSQADFNSSPDFLNGIEPQFCSPTLGCSPGGGQVSRRQVLTWAVHSTFGTTMTNEARVGYQRAPVAFDLFNDYATSANVQFNYPLVTDPTLVQGNLPQGRNTPTRQLLDNFAWVKGRHTFRVGGEWKLVLADSFFFNNVVPTVNFGSISSNSNNIIAGDFLGGISTGALSDAGSIYNIVTGNLSSISRGFNHTSPTSGFVPGLPRTVDPIQHNLAGYFQDSWKMWANLTWTYGVRYEYQGVIDLRNGLVLLPVDDLSGLWGPAGMNNIYSPRPLGSPVLNDTLLNFSGHNNGRPVYQRDINNFAPFLGFAWDPFKDGKTSIRAGGTVHFTQDGFTLFQLAGTGNTGLFSVVSNSTPTGVLNTASIPFPAPPVATFPVSQKQNMINNTLANLWVFDPALKTPYVIEWNLGVSRELWKRLTVEARYVGNHAVKLFRSTDINEINMLTNPFTCVDRAAVGTTPALVCGASNGFSVANLLTDFQNAQQNRVICGGTAFGGCAGALPTPIFSALFSGIAAGSGFSSSGFLTQLSEGRFGEMMDSIRRSNTYRVNREANFPLNFFVPNPWANQAFLVDNSSWSYYHGVEFEVRRRFSSGLFFQANYTFGKVLTDARFLTSQNESQTYRSLKDRRLDKNRAAFDVTHSISANFIYPLPFGKGKWLGSNANSMVDKLIGGWSIQGLTRIASGAPFTSISSGRVTTGAFITQPAVLRNMTASQLQKQIGVFKVPGGVFWLNPNSGLINITTGTSPVSGLPTTTSTAVRCTVGQTTPCFDFPAAGQEGNMPFFGLDAPRFVNQDLSVIKRTPVPVISEAFNFEIRFEFFNVFNHPNFGTLTTNIDSTASFGKLGDIVDTVRGGGVNTRIIQWAIRVNW